MLILDILWFAIFSVNSKYPAEFSDKESNLRRSDYTSSGEDDSGKFGEHPRSPNKKSDLWPIAIEESWNKGHWAKNLLGFKWLNCMHFRWLIIISPTRLLRFVSLVSFLLLNLIHFLLLFFYQLNLQDEKLLAEIHQTQQRVGFGNPMVA